MAQNDKTYLFDILKKKHVMLRYFVEWTITYCTTSINVVLIAFNATDIMTMLHNEGSTYFQTVIIF